MRITSVLCRQTAAGTCEYLLKWLSLLWEGGMREGEGGKREGGGSGKCPCFHLCFDCVLVCTVKICVCVRLYDVCK